MSSGRESLTAFNASVPEESRRRRGYPGRKKLGKMFDRGGVRVKKYKDLANPSARQL